MSNTLFKDKESENPEEIKKQKRQEKAKREFDKLVNEIKREYISTLDFSMTFPVLFNKILEKKISLEEFRAKSSISRQSMTMIMSGKYKRNKKEIDYFPSIRIIITISIVCELDMLMTRKLLRVAGVNFDETRTLHYTYFYLVTHCKGKSIEYCNKVLKEMGAEDGELLGEKKYKRSK